MFQRLGIGYFLLGAAVPFVIVDPRSIVSLIGTMAPGLVLAVVAFVGFQVVAGTLVGGVTDIDTGAATPTRTAYDTTFVAVAVAALAFTPVRLVVMDAVGPAAG